ncbi:MAG: ABC transporter permease [Proteobacteria bacterium]|nr:ABC transporter permease [Pseudomonadota bacterium]MBI3496151.1 ABC transporter permease [Pseudomonadota bacterium]
MPDGTASVAAVPAMARRRGRRNVYLTIGAAMLAAYVGVAAFGAWLVPYGGNDQDLLGILSPPSASHLLGTDQIGRDLLSRLILGTRFTLTVAIASVAIAATFGVSLGVAAGYFGSRIDAAITGLVDLLLTVPNLILAIAIASVIGAGMTGLIAATTTSFVPPLARLIRGRVMEIRQEDFVQAAITVGMGDVRIIVRHVLPNALTVIVIETSLLAGQAVLVGSALGFLGLGVQPPAPEWGTMLSGGREFLEVAPHLVVAPGIAISLLVFSFNLFGDGLRDRLDPNYRA